MTKFNAQETAAYIKDHKQPVLVAGDGCDNIELGGKKLIEYAALIAEKLNCPVAATGNTILYLRKKGGLKAKKMWLAELFRYLDDDWPGSLVDERPDLLVMIGYHPNRINGMVKSARNIHTVFLGPGNATSAEISTEEVPLKDWQSDLDGFINEL